jgi:hypothetical protein
MDNKYNTPNSEMDLQSRHNNPITIGATCIAQIAGNFFLLVEIEIGANTEEVIVFTITAAQAAQLLRLGVPRCRISNSIPTSRPGTDVDLICAFVVDTEVILVFDVENTSNELVLVRVPLCTVIE